MALLCRPMPLDDLIELHAAVITALRHDVASTIEGIAGALEIDVEAVRQVLRELEGLGLVTTGKGH